MRITKLFAAASFGLAIAMAFCIAQAAEPSVAQEKVLDVDEDLEIEGQVEASAARFNASDRERFMKLYVPHQTDAKQRTARRCALEKRLINAFDAQPVIAKDVDQLFSELQALDRDELEKRSAYLQQLKREFPLDRAVLLVFNDRGLAKSPRICN